MRPVALFRALVVGSVLTGLAGAAFDDVVAGALSDDLREAHEEYRDVMTRDAITPVLVIAGLIALPIYLVMTIGLLLLKPWSRALALWMTLVTVPLNATVGAVVHSGWAMTLMSAASVLWGAALAMAYTSEVKTHFETTRSSPI